MSVACPDVKAALRDPLVSSAALKWLECSERLSDLLLEASRLDEDGDYADCDRVELAIAPARTSAARCAQELDEAAGEQLARKIRVMDPKRIKEWAVKNTPASSVKTAPEPSGGSCRARGCPGVIQAKGVCNVHYHRIRGAVSKGFGKWGDAAFEARAMAGEFARPKTATRERPGRPATVKGNSIPSENYTLTDVQAEIVRECDGLRELLLAKNKAYGNSAIEPVRVFSKASPVEQIRVRLDDKLSRLMKGEAAGEDVELDLMGYLILLRIARRRESPALA